MLPNLKSVYKYFIHFQPLIFILFYVAFRVTSITGLPEDEAERRKSEYRCRCGISNSKSERIMGGVDAEKHEFPWHAAILTKKNRMFCGATLLNDRHILTAAHCLADIQPDGLSVVLGEHYYQVQSPHRYSIEKWTIHPQYKAQDYLNDIAIIRLVRTVTYTPNIHPPCIPKPGMDYSGSLGTVIGWGQLVENGGYPDVLQKVNVPILSTESCIQKYGKEAFLPSMLCASWKEGKRDSCIGDSGGPLLLELNSRWNLIGIVSWGHGCGWANYPAAYTRVDSYLKWISANSRDGKACTG